MHESEIREIGQNDFLLALEDYWAAALSWAFFISAVGSLDAQRHRLTEAINNARLANPYDYLLNTLLFDTMMAICRLTDKGPDCVSLPRIRQHLKVKRQKLVEEQLSTTEVDIAISEIRQFENSEAVSRIRDRRLTQLAHRIDSVQVEIAYGQLEDGIKKLAALFSRLGPMFRATKGYAESPVEQHKPQFDRFWKAVEEGAKKQ